MNGRLSNIDVIVFQAAFVASLREKLAKPDLRLLLQSLRCYRDDGHSELLFKTLKTYRVNRRSIVWLVCCSKVLWTFSIHSLS